MATQHFFLGDKWIGSRPIHDFVDLGEGARQTSSYALFCPHCASVWGKLMHDHPQGAYCQPITSCCPKHAVWPSDGTFLSQHGHSNPDDPRGWTDDLPLSVLQHDVLALCEYYLAHPDKLFLIRS